MPLIFSGFFFYCFDFLKGCDTKLSVKCVSDNNDIITFLLTITLTYKLKNRICARFFLFFFLILNFKLELFRENSNSIWKKLTNRRKISKFVAMMSFKKLYSYFFSFYSWSKICELSKPLKAFRCNLQVIIYNYIN